MSRWLISASLIASLATFATADRVTQHRFAQPPSSAQVRVAPEPQLDRDVVRAQLVANRSANLARFRAYQKKGIFPSNTMSDRRLNVWRDDQGHLCAAATIIRASGQVALVDKVAEQSNFIRLADVEDGPLMDWILTSGFTQDEIAAIQEPFEPVSRQPVFEPEQPTPVDPDMRSAENQRLMAKYRQVDAMLVKNQKKSIELAVDRLMAHPDLAAQLLSL
jgi:hypothetical protein